MPQSIKLFQISDDWGKYWVNRLIDWLTDYVSSLYKGAILVFSARWLVFSVSCFLCGSAIAGTLSFSAASYSVAENASTVTITVNRSGSTVAAASVTVVSAIGTASIADFTAVSQALTWGIGDSDAKTFTVAILDDALVEVSETLTLKFTSAVGDGTGGNATVTITDYEEGKFQFSSASFSGLENSLNLYAKIDRVSGMAGAATVKIKTSASTLKPNASDLLDYIDLDTTVSFLDGETTKYVPVTLKNDNVAEFSEWVKLTLSSPTGATLGSLVTADGEIQDTDEDFTSTIKLLTKKVKNVEQSQLVDLAQNSLMDSTKKVLDLVNTIPILTLTGLTAAQDADGLMIIDVETNRAYLRPVYVKRVPNGTAPDINIRDDINSKFITSQGWALEAQPALAVKGMNVLQKGLAEIFLPDLVITDMGNITIQEDQGAPPFERDSSGNVVVNYKFYNRWNLRPSIVSSVASSSTEGFSLLPHPLDQDEVVVSVVYNDGNQYRQQILSSAPINGPELIQELTSNGIDRCAYVSSPCKVGVSAATQLNNGIVKIDVPYAPVGGAAQTLKLTVFSDYKIRKVPNFKSSMVGFTETNDINRDSFGDYKMVYANGEEQYFFLVSSFIED